MSLKLAFATYVRRDSSYTVNFSLNTIENTTLIENVVHDNVHIKRGFDGMKNRSDLSSYKYLFNSKYFANSLIYICKKSSETR